MGRNGNHTKGSRHGRGHVSKAEIKPNRKERRKAKALDPTPLDAVLSPREVIQKLRQELKNGQGDGCVSGSGNADFNSSVGPLIDRFKNNRLK